MCTEYRTHIIYPVVLQEWAHNMGLTVEAGAVPALPQLYKCRCFMDAALAQDELVYFNAGEHERLVAMTMHDYKSLVAPVVLSFAHEINSNIRCATPQTDHQLMCTRTVCGTY